MTHYAELHCLSAFSFRRGASQPGELVARAAGLGYRALALTDECSMAGIVRAHEAAREHGLKLIIGSEFRLDDGLELVLLAPDQSAYGQICSLITRARRRSEKGSYRLGRADLDSGLDKVLALWTVSDDRGRWPDDDDLSATARWLAERFAGRLWLAAARLLRPGEQALLDRLERLGRRLGLPRLACGGVRMHTRRRRRLLDVLTALDQQTTVNACGLALAANGERHLRPLATLERLYPRDWLDNSVAIAERCEFSLDRLSYRYPRELAPAPLTPGQHLRRLTLAGMRRRYPQGPPDSVRALIARELSLIEDMGVEAFFLTVHDIVRFARERGILCQGRGSAANSAVCFCLGITEVDPACQQLLFERFLSKERNEPPDIDVDFEHERREEVLQYLYDKYSRERAALAATVICYRPRSALKDVGRALGLDPVRMNRLTASLAWWDRPECWPERLTACGFDPDSPTVGRLLELSGELLGFPRHLSQHVGGMVIADQPLHHLVPVENAAMPERTIIQWDKDDLESLGLLKVDCLALGMLTAISKTLAEINAWPAACPDQAALELATIPREDAATYDMLCRGDAIGVFQVESRAQMAMLPRLKPRCFYDLVIEVAIVRPGPIQGDMVHPYLARRADPSQVSYPSPQLESVLRRTLGVPIFQEQVMQIAMVAAGFSAGEADQLRRAMAAWKRRGGLEPFRQRLIDGMLERGYEPEFAERLYSQICGFGDYGFPESHAASFALLTYFSAWLKCHHPAAFTCGLLNSQPMGFYAPAQLINDVRRHGVRVLPVDVSVSEVDCSLQPEPGKPQTPAIRLGLRLVRGLAGQAARAIVEARRRRALTSVVDLTERAGLDRRQLNCLAEAGALKSLAGHRRRARWQALASRRQGDLLAGLQPAEQAVRLAPQDQRSDLVDDYASLGLSLDHHPLRLLRPALGRRVLPAHSLARQADNSPVEVAGLVTHRQRPGTASGVIFLSLEDETGIINVIVWPKLVERFRQAVLGSRILRVRGTLQNSDGTCHVIAQTLIDESARLAEITHESRDFH